MKYTLAQNAISSLHIACKHFKNFFYDEKRENLRESEMNEEIKIALIFIENAIELLLKTIMVTKKETSIYKHPNSKAIKQVQENLQSGEHLEDALLSVQRIQTLSYSEIVLKYFDKRRRGFRKVRDILLQLAQLRNSITHFGIEVLNYDEILTLFYNAFDVIYNYLFKVLIEIPDIKEYFTSDDWIVKTVHGDKNLVDVHGIYNNFIDFFDEIVEVLNDEIFEKRVGRSVFNICNFSDLLSSTVCDKNFENLLKKYRFQIDKSEIHHDYYMQMLSNEEEMIALVPRYSVFFNASIFMDESSGIQFVVLHNTNEMYLYSSWVQYPEIDKSEADEQWKKDEQKGKCEKVVLSKRNLIRAFERFLQTLNK